VRPTGKPPSTPSISRVDPAREDAELRRLIDEVVRTRKAHRHELSRHRQATHTSIKFTRQDSLAALETYLAALQARHLPAPPTMQRDLALLRALCGGVPRTGAVD